jgi:hypothetical protein
MVLSAVPATGARPGWARNGDKVLTSSVVSSRIFMKAGERLGWDGQNSKASSQTEIFRKKIFCKNTIMAAYYII